MLEVIFMGYEERLLELTRKGAIDKVKWLKNINKIILPSQKKRIQQNDKSVLNDLVLPKWVTWDILYEWASQKVAEDNTFTCILCNNKVMHGTNFRGKHICQECLNELKRLHGEE